MVPIEAPEVMTGWVSFDDIETLYEDEVRADVGAPLGACHAAHRGGLASSARYAGLTAGAPACCGAAA